MENERSFFDLLFNFITTDEPNQRFPLSGNTECTDSTADGTAVCNAGKRERKRDKFRRASSEFKTRTLDPQTEFIERKAKEQLIQLDQFFSKRKNINQFEKIWYTMSMLDIFFCGIVVAHFPKILHIVYTIELAFLIPIRFVMYHKKNFQFYLADLCYFVNFLMLLYIWVWPYWTPLWISCFGFSFGTLAISIALWRNSLVMQSVDKTTSTFIHIFPPLVCYTINFRLDDEFKLQRFSGALKAEKWQTVNSVVWVTALYFVWQSLYHYFITVKRAKQIREGTVTSFEFMRRKYAKAWIGKFVNSLPGPLPVFAFTLIQFVFQLVTMLPCALYYKYEWLSTVFLLSLFSIASYNGATYYIDVYGNRFRNQVKDLQDELNRVNHSDEPEPDAEVQVTS